MRTQEQVNEIVRLLLAEYPQADCTLDWRKDYELLFSVRLAAQCTDERVNKITPALFERFPTLEAFAAADVEEVERYVHSCGFYRAKARDIVLCARKLVAEYGGRVPDTMEALTSLPGVGRKSAQRLAFHVLSLPEEEALKFAAAIVDAKKNIHCCSICQNLTDQETCTICASPKRDQGTICVVAQPRDVLSFERSREYNGVYHVLHGVLSPMNHIGPDDIRIQRSDEVADDWHPRFQDTVKTYEYCFLNRRIPDPMRRLYSYFIYYPMDVENMQKAADYLIGEHDFKSFCTPRTQVRSTVRTIYDLTLTKEGDEIRMRITGNGFLYNMVRIIAGTLARVGTGLYTPERVKEILEAKDRNVSGPKAPPQGLTLISIAYPAEEKE